MQANLDILDSIRYTPEEIEFAKKIMKEYGQDYEGIDRQSRSAGNNHRRS